MKRRLVAATRLFLRVQYRSGFVHVYLGLALFTVLIVRLFVPTSWRSFLVPALLLGEYGTMGVFMVAAQSYLARNERSTLALAVTPLRRVERVASLVLASGLLATVSGSLVFAGVMGVDRRVLWLVLPLLATAVLSGSVGLMMAARFGEFTRFLMGAIPVVTIFSLPFLSFFDLVPRYSFAWLPWDAALYSFANLVSEAPRLSTYLLLVLQLLVFAAAALVGAVRYEVVD